VCSVEPGHVLRVMRPGDLIGSTRRDLATAATRVGGSVAALLAFSCVGRHAEAASRGTSHELAAAYAAYAAVGCHSLSEQSGHAARQPHTDRSCDRSAQAMTTRPRTEAERITELQDELAAAQRTIDVLIARLERTGATPPTQAELFDAAVRLGNVLEERTREVEDARAEFRALRANLDQIVRQRTRALAESEAQLRAKNAELERQGRSRPSSSRSRRTSCAPR